MSALLEELARAPEVQPGSGIGPGALVGGRFEILRELGRGGFGVVFEARDRELSRLVAVKVVRTRRGVDPRMLRAEAEAAATLQHPCIVTVHDLGHEGGEGWLVLELLRGETLEDRLRHGPLPAPEALRVATEVGRGLDHAHRAGVLHRDLKPANVFLCEDGSVKILDFGLSRLFGTGSGPEGGTPAYMAPEQWRRNGEDERTDVFAFGVLLFEALSGRRPYAVESGRSAVLDDGPPPQLPPGLAPRPVRALVRQCLSRDPADRPRDGGAALEALLAADRASVANRGRRRLALSVFAVLAVALAGFGTWRLLRTRDLAPGQRVPVAVADFENATTDPELNGLSGMLATSLEQSRRLTVLTRSRLADLVRQTGREVPDRIDESLAREVGRTAGVKALLLATVHRFDDLYAIEVRALDPDRNEYLFTLKAEGTGKASIPGMIDRLSAETRERLREEPTDLATRRRVADVTTADLAAWDHYFRARKAMDSWQPDAARRELEAALAVDPSFALAHYQRAVLDAWTPLWLKASRGEDEASRRTLQEHLVAAERMADRLPEREQLALLAWKATLDRRPDEARRLRDQAAELYPQDKEAAFWAGDVRFHLGDRAAAAPHFERAVKLDPDYALALDHLAWSYDALGRPEQELSAARRFAAVARSADAERWVGRALLSLDRRDEAEASFRRASAIDGRPFPPTDLGSWLAFHGHPHDAEAIAREGLAAARLAPAGPDAGADAPGPELASWSRLLVNALGQQGRVREAWAVVDALPASGAPASDAASARLALATALRSREQVLRAVAQADRAGLRSGRALLSQATALALVGDLAAARSMAERARAAPDAGDVEPALRASFEAVLAWREGRLDEAEAALRGFAGSPEVAFRYAGLSRLGELLVERGRYAEAVTALEEARTVRWFLGTGESHPWLQPAGLLLLARAYEQLGNHALAEQRVDELLRLWDRADRDLPRLAEARTLRARLVTPGGQATQR